MCQGRGSEAVLPGRSFSLSVDLKRVEINFIIAVDTMRSVSPLLWKWNAGNETSWNEDITNLWHLFITHTRIEMSQVELRTTVTNCCSNHLVSFFPQTINFPIANAVVKANLHSDAACAPVFVCSFVLWHGWWVWVSFTQQKVNLF